ncbi:MAG: TolC family outer membrane protein [Pseudomonadales bacterium]|jgi:outer membrane protein|nr:TolC family outer membrane protein [Pseudomonadales bacterium]
MPAASRFATAGDAWTDSTLPPLPTLTPEMERQWENTLAGIYELALRNDPVLSAAEATYRAGLEERRIARAGLLPQVNGSYQTSDVEQESRGAFAAGAQVFPNETDSTIDASNWNIALEQPLFDLGAWFNFRRGAELSEQARATFTQSQQDLIVRTVGRYFDVLRAAANLSASRAEENALAAQLDQVQQRFEVGLVAITDVYEAKAGYDTAVANRIADDAALDVALEILSTITGRPHAQLWTLRKAFPVIDPTPDDVEPWLAFTREHNIDLLVSALGRDAAMQAARAAASQHLPRVSLSLSHTESQSDVDQFDLISQTASNFARDNQQDVIALNVTVPVFSGLRVSGQRRQAYARYDSTVETYEGTLRNVTQATRAFYINVKRDVARTRARAQAIISTQSALEAAQTGYEVGTRNVVDVLIAQRAVFSAIRDHDNSIIDFVQDVVSLKRQAGILTPADIVELNRWLEPPAAPTASGSATGTPTGAGPRPGNVEL